MTNEEGINGLEVLKQIPHAKNFVEHIDFAIKSLEQQLKTDVLDKIRAEIDGLTYYWCEVHPRSVIDDVLKIIDKYKAESEQKE